MDDTGEDISGQINRALAAQAVGEDLFFLTTIYDQADPMNASGQVYKHPIDGTGRPDLILSVNEGLSMLWASPEGSLWVGSSDGNVWTTAPVAFPPHRGTRLAFDTPDPSYAWSVTTLPDMRAKHRPPNITTLWGTSDRQVFAATFEGTIYIWDGMTWAEMDTGVTSGLNEVHGSAIDDVYCVGHDAVILHYDGRIWRQVKPPQELPPWAVLTGVRSTGLGGASIVENKGKVLEGNRQGFRVTAEADVTWTGIAHFQDRWILAAGPGGVWEMTQAGLASIKPNLSVVDVFEAGDLLVFVEGDQDPRPAIVVFQPGNADSPWSRWEF
jgi:hypothetical protein